jgi:hypothetical protein
MTASRAAAAGLGAALLAAALAAPPAARALESGHEALARRFVAAVNAGDAIAQVDLLHPATRACLTEETRDFFDEVLARERAHPIPPRYRVAVTPVDPGAPLLMEGAFTYAVRPSHQLQLDWDTGAQASRGVVRYLARDGEAWRIVIGCPTAETLRRGRAARAEQARRQAEARGLVDALPAPLRAELAGLLREGRTVEAVRRYREATGADLATARTVVELLRPPGAGRR